MQTQHVISLECAPDTLASLGDGFLDGFSHEHSDVRLDIREACDRQVDEDLASGACDVALVASPYDPRFTTLEIYCCPVCFWIRPDDPLANKRLLYIEDLADKPIAMANSESKAYDRLKRLAFSSDVELGRVVHFSEAHRRHAFASEGRGLGFTLRHLREHPLFRTGSAVAAPLDGVSWSFAVACMANRQLTPSEQAFWNWCAFYREQLTCDEWCNKHITGVCTREP